MRHLVLLQLTSIVMVTKDTEQIRLRKCQFLRRLLLVLLNSVIMVTACTEHIRYRKGHFVRRLLLLLINPVIMVTTCTQHTRPRKYTFLRRGDFTRKLVISKITIQLHILGPENATFLGRFHYYSLTQL